MTHFVAKYSGGRDAKYLRDVELFASGLRRRREIPHGVFKMLADIQLAQAPLYVIGMLKAALSAPDNQCRDGFSRLITSADCAQVASTKKDMCCIVNSKCAIIEEYFRDQVKDGLTEPQKAKFMGNFQCRCVHFVHNKTKGVKNPYKSLGDISNDFLTDVYNVNDQLKALPAPWVWRDPSASAPVPDRSASTSNALVEFMGGGIAASTLAQVGFVKGACVVVKSGTGPIYKIDKVSEKEFVLKAIGMTRSAEKRPSDSVIVVSAAKMSDDYKVQLCIRFAALHSGSLSTGFTSVSFPSDCAPHLSACVQCGW